MFCLKDRLAQKKPFPLHESPEVVLGAHLSQISFSILELFHFIFVNEH